MNIKAKLSMIVVINLLFCSLPVYAKKSGSALVRPFTIKQHEFAENFLAIGKCSAEGSKAYYAQSSGTVDSINVSPGTIAKEGEVIMIIDHLIAKSLKKKAESAYAAAKNNYTRSKSLAAKKMISPSLLDKARLSAKSAKADLQTARDRYENMIITAPFEAHVGVIHPNIGTEVKMGNYLFSLIPANAKKKILVELPEKLSGRVSASSEVVVTDRGGKPASGSISSISNYVNNSGTISAKLSFPAETNILHGSYVEAKIIFNKHTGLSIPESTILKNNQGNFVYKIEESKIKQVYVKTHIRDGDLIEITSDQLKAGDQIVLEGLTKVYEGSSVDILEEEKQEQRG